MAWCAFSSFATFDTAITRQKYFRSRAVAYAVKISRTQSKMDTLLLHVQTINRKLPIEQCHFRLFLSDLQGHSHIASLYNAISHTSRAAVDRFSTDAERRAVPLRQRSLLLRSVRRHTRSRITSVGIDRSSFFLDHLRTGLRPGSNRFELSRHVEIARTCSNLVAHQFEAKSHYAILVGDRSEAGRRPAGSC